MFGKKSTDTTAVADDTPTVTADAPKGRPTPTRKEAEAARKEELKADIKSKGGKAGKASEKAAVRAAREKNRKALLAGDDSALPARDQGPVKAAVRDFVDRRRTLAEFFVPIAVVVLLTAITRNPQLQVFATLMWMIVLVVVILNVGYLLFRLNKELKAKFPDASERKGVNFYAVMRMVQLRPLRLPKPKIKAGGAPVIPKAPKKK